MKKVNQFGKLKIISRMISNMIILKDLIDASHNPTALIDCEINAIADLYADVEKLEQLTELTLFEKLKIHNPDNKTIQRNIERLMWE